MYEYKRIVCLLVSVCRYNLKWPNFYFPYLNTIHTSFDFTWYGIGNKISGIAHR